MNPLNHVAIIMDGNGRWGFKHKNSRNAGHKEGLVTIEKIIKETAETRISERGATRLDDQMSEASMEQRKKEGYF